MKNTKLLKNSIVFFAFVIVFFPLVIPASAGTYYKEHTWLIPGEMCTDFDYHRTCWEPTITQIFEANTAGPYFQPKSWSIELPNLEQNHDGWGLKVDLSLKTFKSDWSMYKYIDYTQVFLRDSEHYYVYDYYHWDGTDTFTFTLDLTPHFSYTYGNPIRYLEGNVKMWILSYDPFGELTESFSGLENINSWDIVLNKVYTGSGWVSSI
ncbi:MAG: hypothetical protein ACW967_06820 [Candidatus Hodarchaeales archaeon]|jgi:hypothetical protein